VNRLKHTRGYLCGAMDRESDGGEGWRIKLQQELASLETYWLDPTHKPIDTGIEDVEMRAFADERKACGDYNAIISQIKTIRCVDLRMVDISDFLVVNLDIDIHPCGSYEELFLANRQKKPIIVHMEQGKKHTPTWLLGTLPHQMIFSTWSEVYQYIRHIAHDPIIGHVDRWFFFNFDMCRKFKFDKERN
jgi:hypothetical protein